ncbi:MAG: HAD-IIB family hydrolase [Methylococcaceae bacterium]|jgi:hypothetical protein
MDSTILICTDLDRTLLPNGSQPESPKARQLFASLVSRPEVTLAYVSGRDLGLVEAAITEYQLPIPDWIIADVGTSLYQQAEPGWQAWHAWEQDIASDWQGQTAADLKALFSDLALLSLQEESRQKRYKLSYYLPLQADIISLQNTMMARLKAQQLQASLIYSEDAAAQGLLDILPARATKLHAVEFLMRQLGFNLNNTVFAGDSGNDLPVIASPINSVLVANAALDVIQQARQLIQLNNTESAFYLAQGNFKGLNGNYSAGILEGVAYFLPATQQWM